ncbi:MAG: hypothetical protein WDO73_23155 [Ignavibacteriota bacterium]
MVSPRAAQPPSAPVFHPYSYASRVVDGARTYRVLLPAGYEQARQRYPVVYWLHSDVLEPAARENRLAAYVAAHELILVDPGPVDLASQFALSFPELVEQVDRNLRTVGRSRASRSRGHGRRGASWPCCSPANSPDQLGSVSSFEGTPEAFSGPDAFPRGIQP